MRRPWSYIPGPRSTRSACVGGWRYDGSGNARRKDCRYSRGPPLHDLHSVSFLSLSLSLSLSLLSRALLLTQHASLEAALPAPPVMSEHSNQRQISQKPNRQSRIAALIAPKTPTTRPKRHPYPFPFFFGGKISRPRRPTSGPISEEVAGPWIFS